MKTAKRKPENSGNTLQTNYSINPPEEEPIQENPPEEHPEDLSASNFEIERKKITDCPDCHSKNIEFTTTGGLDPQDTLDFFFCMNCGWNELQKNEELKLEEVCF